MRRNSALLQGALGLLVVAASRGARAEIRYVSADAAPSGNGRSWDRAFNRLQDALAAARSGDELWIAEGTYLPGLPTDGRDVRFVLPDGVALYGGFAGDETTRDQRDPAARPTLLSGDLDGDGDFSGNAYHVVEASGVGEDTLLDGLIITGGNADGPYPKYFGGGLLTYFGRPTITRCTFTANRAVYGGGLLSDGGSPRLTDCLFERNEAQYGGGALVGVAGQPRLEHCRFDANLAEVGAGLVVSDDANGAVLFCEFVNNQSTSLGAGAHVESASPAIIGCRFDENVSPRGAGLSLARSGSRVVSNRFLLNDASAGGESGNGGGVYISSGNPALINCTLLGNRSIHGGGLFSQLADVALVNCVFWDNSDQSGEGREAQIQVVLTEISANYCFIQGYDGLPTGSGNRSDDPLLDRVGRLTAGSPCIDAGDSTALPADVYDLDGDGDVAESSSLDAESHERRMDDPATPDTGRGGAPVVDVGAFELHCTGIESVKANCTAADGGFQIKATAKRGQPGAGVTFRLNGAEPRFRIFDAGGKAKAKWHTDLAGVHEVSIESACGRLRSQATECG